MGYLITSNRRLREPLLTDPTAFNSLLNTQIRADLAQRQLLELSADKAESRPDIVRKGKTKIKEEGKRDRESWTVSGK